MDILINNAGICVLEDFMDISSDSFDEVIAINTRAPLLISQVHQVSGPDETEPASCVKGRIKKLVLLSLTW